MDVNNYFIDSLFRSDPIHSQTDPVDWLWATFCDVFEEKGLSRDTAIFSQTSLLFALSIMTNL